MPKPYGINGTPWHVERVHNNDPDDTRRHRARCVYYVSANKTCLKNSSCCYGAAHCKYYKEKVANTVVDNVFEESGIQSVPTSKQTSLYRPQIKPVGGKKIQASKRNDKIRFGTVICKGGLDYFVWDIEQDEDLNFIYICRMLVNTEKTKVNNPGPWVYGKYYLTAHRYVIKPDEIGSVKTIEPEIVKRVLDDRKIQEAKDKLIETKKKEEMTGSVKHEQYTIVPMDTIRKPEDIPAKSIYVVIKIGNTRKQLPAYLDKRENKIYMERLVYLKYRAGIFSSIGFDILSR